MLVDAFRLPGRESARCGGTRALNTEHGIVDAGDSGGQWIGTWADDL
jgi:hypothetical protein